MSKVLPQYIHDGVDYIHQWFDKYILPFYEGLIAYSSQLNTGQQNTVHHSLETILSDVGTHLSNLLQYILNGFADFLLALPNTMTVLFFCFIGGFFSLQRIGL
ncbi:MAG: hypothetical protein LRY73_01285 [Bacillus sp. (in: Bacteria)]|nr:hypothetical protein [Bacillus sp. (in: firmicutes)]